MGQIQRRFGRGNIRMLLAAPALVLIVAGSLVYASIPSPDGVINGCRHKQSGALRVIDSATSCNPSTEVSLNWNQAGSPAPSDAYSASDEGRHVGAEDTTIVSVDVPPGSYTVAAKAHLFNSLEDSFAICELRAAGTAIDGSILRLIAPANDQVAPFLGVASLPAGGTISLVCNGNGVTTVETQESRLVATKVGSLH